MPNITIGRMSKKINSMRRTFDENSTVDVSVKLKEKTTEHDPVFILQGLPLDNDYNYCKWGRRRYWINKKVYVTNDIMEFYCNLDPLATFHDSILDSTGFCSFADKEHWNDLLDDPRFGAEIEIPGNPTTWIYPIASTVRNEGAESWTVVFRTLAMKENLYSVPSVYVMTVPKFWMVLSKIGNEITKGWTGNPSYDVSNALQKLMGGDPMDTILSVYVLPIPISKYKELVAKDIDDYWQETSTMLMGTFDPINIGEAVGDEGKVWTTKIVPQIDPIEVQGSVSLQWPRGTQNYRFLRYPKYTSLQLRYPNGVQEINDNKLASNLKEVRPGVYYDLIHFKLVMHPWTGEYFLYILSDSERNVEEAHEVLASTHGMCGMSLMDYVSITDSNYSAGDMLTGLVRKIPSVLASYAIPAGSSVSTTTIEGGATTTFESWEGTSGGMFNDPFSGHSGTRNIVEPKNISKTNSYYNNGIHGLFQAFGGQSGTPHDSTLPAGIFATFLQPTHVGSSDLKKNWAVIVASIVAPRIFTKYNENTRQIEFDDENYVNHCEEYGWPCNKRLKLGDIGNTPTERGKDHYVKCEGFSWTPQNLVHPELDPLSANAEDIAFVNNMVNSGIYITHDSLEE